MSQLSLVEEESQSSKASPTTTRNPFMSPWTDLFDELISSTKLDQEKSAERSLNKEQLDVISSLETFVTTVQESFGNDTLPVEPPAPTSTTNIANDMFQKASTQVEAALLAASTAVSPDVFNSVIKQARNVLKLQDDLVAVATTAAEDKGLDVLEAAERARNTTTYVASLVSVADQVLRSGYVQKEEDAAIGNREDRQAKADEFLSSTTESSPTTTSSSSGGSNALFENIPSAQAISYDEFGPAISTIAEMGWLSGGIYENAIERSHELGHSIVAQGISSNVFWVSRGKGTLY